MGKRAEDDSTGRISRRDFLRKSFSIATAFGASSLVGGAGVLSSASASTTSIPKGPASPAPGVLASSVPGSPASSTSGRLSRALVIVARKVNGGNDPRTFYNLLTGASIARLAGTARPDDAWAKFFGPNDIVAIKVNAIGGKKLSTSPVLVAAIIDGLKSCGVRPDRIIVWDRTCRELDSAGFQVNFNGEGPFCYGTDAPSTGYESSPTILGPVGSCFSRIITEDTTALINVPILREHSVAGVSVALKNNYGAIHNPNKYHDDGCTPFVADVNTHPDIRKKTRLVICDALDVQFNGGPGYKPKWTSRYEGILVGTDPVALDTVGTEKIDGLRKAGGLRSLSEESRYPGYLSVASDGAHLLGISDRARIDLIDMELA